LATAANISVPTVKRLEAQDGPVGGRSETGSKIRFALERAGIEFIDENGGGPGVRMRKRLRRRPPEWRPYAATTLCTPELRADWRSGPGQQNAKALLHSINRAPVWPVAVPGRLPVRLHAGTL